MENKEDDDKLSMAIDEIRTHDPTIERFSPTFERFSLQDKTLTTIDRMSPLDDNSKIDDLQHGNNNGKLASLIIRDYTKCCIIVLRGQGLFKITCP